VFRGEVRELSALRRWLVSLLPDCPARDDVLSVATELGSNAIEHTASGHGGWFAVEVTWHPSVVQVAVADAGGSADPQVIDDPAAERGRGLLLVRGLSVRTGFTGDQRGRLVWAHIAWDDLGRAACPPSQDGYQAAILEGAAVLARRFAGVPAWFGRSTLAWWAMAGPAGLVSAPTARDLASLLDALGRARAGPVSETSAQERPVAHRRRQSGAGGGDAARRGRPGTAGAFVDGRGRGRLARGRRPVVSASAAIVAACWPGAFGWATAVGGSR
jgi:Histidine kinase-like ATPase domain